MKLLQLLLLGLSACVIAAVDKSTVPVSSVSLKTSEHSTNLDISTESTISHLTKKSPSEIGTREKKSFCYYSNKAQHRSGTCACLPEDLDPKLCSHLVYSYASIDEKNHTVIPTDPQDDIPNGGFEKFNNLKKISNAKTMLAVGGHDMGIGNMTNMLQTTITRGNFIASLILILRNFGFDGVCIDFFYPGHGKSPLGDKTLFTLLCKEMRVAFDEEAKRTGNQTLLMVVTVAGNKEIIDNGYELHDISECANFIDLITYNLYNESNFMTEHHSALYPSQGLSPVDAQNNVEWVAKYCEEQGVPKNKIIIGMPLYGRTFTLKNASDDGIGAPIVGPGPAGECTQIPGLLSYTKICSLLTDSSATKVWMADAKVPYVSKDTLWVGYDDKESLETKVRWLVEKGYGGYWAWTGDLDDCKGLNCNQGPFPLMNTLHRTMMGSVTGSLPPLTKILESSTKSLTEITETETTGYEMSTPSGLPCERHAEGLFPYPGNCTMYIQCSNHIAHDMPCPQGTYWDPVNVKCNWPSDLTEQRRKECDLH